MAELFLGDKKIWSNPPGLGHFGIKLRKQMREDEIIERMMMRHRAQIMRMRHYDPPGGPLAGIGAESMFEIRRSFARRGTPMDIAVASE